MNTRIDAAIASARAFTKANASQLVIIEDIHPGTKPESVAEGLGIKDANAAAFHAHHRENWGRWHRPAQVTGSSGDYPPSYCDFLARFGSFTWVGRSGLGSGRWINNVTSHGWGLLTLLNEAERTFLTDYFRACASASKAERQKYGLHRLLAFAGFVNGGYAFDTRTHQGGEYPVVFLDEDQLFANLTSAAKLAESAVVPFDSWLSKRIQQVIAELEPQLTASLPSPSGDLLSQAFSALEQGKVEVAETLLHDHPVLTTTRSPRGSTLLFSAALHGCAPLIEKLIAAGADVNVQNQDGTTALMLAARGGHVDVLTRLVKAAVDLESTDSGRSCAFTHALRAKRPEAARHLLQCGAKATAKRLSAAVSLCPSLIDVLLEQGAPLEDPDADYPPLHAAMTSEDPAIAQQLIARGADVNAVSKSGSRPLHVAVGRNNAAGIAVLVAAGADLEAGDHSGDTPLHQAVFYERSSMVEVLVKLGANVNATNKSGKRPLAMLRGSTDQAAKEAITTVMKAAGATSSKKR